MLSDYLTGFLIILWKDLKTGSSWPFIAGESEPLVTGSLKFMIPPPSWGTSRLQVGTPFTIIWFTLQKQVMESVLAWKVFAFIYQHHPFSCDPIVGVSVHIPVLSITIWGVMIEGSKNKCFDLSIRQNVTAIDWHFRIYALSNQLPPEAS